MIMKSNSNRDGQKEQVTHGFAYESQLADIDLASSMYKIEKGCLMNNENGNYYDPLEWWNYKHAKFPNIWLLAQCIISVPATPAPSERVFSAAANIIDKKRAHIITDNANLFDVEDIKLGGRKFLERLPAAQHVTALG
jgi:hypothetical protein